MEHYWRKASNNHMSRARRGHEHLTLYTPSPNGDQQPILELSKIAERQFDPIRRRSEEREDRFFTV